METNSQTGQTRLVTGCFFEVIPRLLQFTVQEQGQTSAEISAMRERTAQLLTEKVSLGLEQGFDRVVSRLEKIEED